jgi:glycosyltransferase involved in cell wall biosynthesis
MKESKPSSKTLRGYLIHVNDGVTYHRHIAPMNALRKIGWEFDYPPFDGGKTDLGKRKDKELHQYFQKADILITQRNDIDKYIATSQLIQAGYKVPWVYDTDDDVHAVRPSNPGFRSYSVNSPHKRWALMAIERAFALTVSTPTLKEIYKKYNKRIHVLPNGIDLARWDKHPRGKKPKGEIRVGLLTSAGHWENIKMVEDVMIEVLKKYPNVVFYTYGGYRTVYMRKVPKELKSRIKWVKWAVAEDWPKVCKDLAIDVGLAPLVDNDFNRSKSNLRWLENTAQGMPTVASDVIPYRTANKDAIVLCRTEAEWFNAISGLIEDPKLRKKIASNARKQAEAEYDISVVAKKYDAAYRQIIKEFKEIYGKPHRGDNYIGLNIADIEDTIKARSRDIHAGNVGKKRAGPVS